MNCPACRQTNREDAKFCAECGHRFASVCASCQTELRPGAKFCDECGAQTGEAAGATRATKTPVPPERSPRDYTPKHLADKILRSKSALEGECKQVTVLFADVKESMNLAEQVGAETWHHILDRFFQILSSGVHRFEGTVNQYTGDGIMALFGAPVAHEDHAQRACYAALRLRTELRSYADELRRTHGLSFSVRIGLNSGEVVVGKIGDDLRMDYTAQGLAVGLAQRMEQLAAADSTYLTQHTANLVEGFFALRDLGEFTLKGVAAPLSVYELEGTGALRTRLDLSRARGFSQFVGRTSELDALEAALQRAIDGQGGTVGVVADAGVGKSRLCFQFIERCRARGIAVFESHCPAHGKLIPLIPVHELMREFFGIVESDTPQATREKIAGRMLLLDREFEAQLPLAFDFLGVADPTRPVEPLEPARQQKALEALIAGLIQARSAREPAVMLVDDMHWIDAGSDEYFARLAETIAGTRTLMLLNFRPEYSAPWMADSSYQQLPLHPLGEEAINGLLSHLLGDDPTTVALRPLIRERSAGNPFFIEEIVQTLIEEGRLTGERGAYRLEGAVEKLRVPTSVKAILAARIDRLDAREKTLLQTAAAIGRRFPDALLREVSGLAADQQEEAIAALRRAEMIHEETLYPEIEYAFRHPLVHEVAGQSQLSEARAAVHAKIATAIEAALPKQDESEAALLAHHWDEADAPEPAARWHRIAAEQVAGSNSRTALRHWERVRELASRVPNEDLARELGRQSRLMILEYGWRLAISPEEANALFEEGEAWAKANDDKHALAEIYNAFAIPCAFSLGELPRAVAISREGLRLAEEVDDEALAFALELRIFFTLGPTGDVLGARDAIHAANRHAPEVMDAATPLIGYDARATAIGFLGWHLSYQGRFEEGIARVRKGLGIARANGSTEVIGWLLAFEAGMLAPLGRNGLQKAREAWEIAEQIESATSLVVTAVELVPLLFAEGDITTAVEVLEHVAPLAADGCKHMEPYVLSLLADARIAEGELEAAKDVAMQALGLAQTRGVRAGEITARTVLANITILAEGTSGLTRADAELEHAFAMATELGQRVLIPRIWELRAELARLRGDSPAQEAALREARELFVTMGAVVDLERVDGLLAAG